MIEEKQQEIASEFSLFDDWMQKYEYIIELSKDLPLIDPSLKTDDRLIRGCQSRVWLQAEQDAEGNVVFTGDSDAIITKGLVALVIRILSGEKPEDIATADLHVIADIGLHQHLSPTRSNGLASMIRQMKWHALSFQQQTEGKK